MVDNVTDPLNAMATRTVAAVFPGGLARQIRVQIRSAAAGRWAQFGVFSRPATARACVARLRAGGYAARIVEIRMTPVAG